MSNSVFFVVCKMANNVDFSKLIATAHWEYDRVERHNKIDKYIGKGRIIASFEVDTNHWKGHEIHNVFDNGIVLIQNLRTREIVTEIVARPPHIARYWNGLNERLPYLSLIAMDKAREHQRKGWNNW